MITRSDLPRTVTFRGDRGSVLVIEGKNARWYVVGIHRTHKLALRLTTTFASKNDALSVAHIAKHQWIALTAATEITNAKELDRIRELLAEEAAIIVR